MKIFNSAILALAIGAASVSSAQAHDSFSFGLNIGGYPPPVFYSPPVVYYNQPVVYYQQVPSYYSYGPSVSYRYSDDGFRGCRRGGGREEHEHHDWDHGGGDRDGWDHDGWGHGGRHDWR